MSENDAKLKKLWEAMGKDEQTIKDETAKLFTMRDSPFNVRVKIGPQEIVIRARRLRISEKAAFYRELAVINPQLVRVDQLENVPLTPEENDRVNALAIRYVELATGIPQSKLKELDDERILTALITGILAKSATSKEELEQIIKFRDDT